MFYFGTPISMTSDTPPTPFLSMDRREIRERVLRKEVLRRAGRDLGAPWTWRSGTAGDTHGEFPTVEEWDKDQAAAYSVWLDKNGKKVVREVLETLGTTKQIDIEGGLRAVSDDHICNALKERSSQDRRFLGEYLADAGLLPLLGLPTRLRMLYTNVDSAQSGNPILRKIDRDINLALTEFAPGAKRIKDKHVYTCDGFSPELYLERGGRIKPEGQALECQQRLLFCPSCQYFLAKRPSDSGGDGDPCPACGNPPFAGDSSVDDFQRFRTIDSWVPNGFRVKSETAGMVGEEDRHGKSGRAFVAVPSLCDEPPSDVCNTSISRTDAAMFRVNDRNGDLYSAGPNSLPIGRSCEIADSGKWAEGQVEATSTDRGAVRFAIHSSRRTDVLRLSHAKIPNGLDLDPRRAGAGVRIAFISAAELIRRAWATHLDISPSEIHVLQPAAIPSPGDPTRWQGLVTLCDDHPNGAGYVDELKTRWKIFLDDFCSATPKYKFVERLIDKEGHAKKCRRACYECLRSYQNRFIDSLLDWRLGYELLKTLRDPSYAVGLLDFPSSHSQSPGLCQWVKEAEAACKSICNSFPEEFKRASGFHDKNLPVLRVEEGEKSRFIVVRHPLWADRSSLVDNVLDRTYIAAKQRSDETDMDPDIIDSFNLWHRPSWTRQRILDRLRGQDQISSTPQLVDTVDE